MHGLTVNHQDGICNHSCEKKLPPLFLSIFSNFGLHWKVIVFFVGLAVR
jgi:hypothetical protein